MGTNTIPTATSGLVIPTDDHNSIKEALTNDLVPRNTDGVATASAGDLGTSSLPFKNINISGNISQSAGLLNTTPSGVISQCIGSAAPQGYLLLNGDTIGDIGSGATHEHADYETLFNLVKTTEVWANGDTVALLDVRGYFIRAWDNGRGIDSGRAINTIQADDNKAHDHQEYGYDSGGIGSRAAATYGVGSGPYTNNTISLSSIAAQNTTGPLNTGSTGTESRPKNIALNYIIKV